MEGIPDNATVVWGSSNLNFVSGNTGRTIKVEKLSDGNAQLIPTVKMSCGNFRIEPIQLWVSKPNFILNGEKELEPRMPGIVEIEYVDFDKQGVTDVKWSCSGVVKAVSGSTHTGKFRVGAQPGAGAVYVTATNNCGSKGKGFGVRVLDDYRRDSYVVSPNPANIETEIRLKEQKSETTEERDLAAEHDVVVVNSQGFQMYKGKMRHNKHKINVSSWPKGTYHVRITDKKQSFATTLIVE